MRRVVHFRRLFRSRTIAWVRAAAVGAVVLIACGCTTTAVAHYRSGSVASENGRIIILLSRTAPRVGVSIDGMTIVDTRTVRTKKVGVVGVPPGEHLIHVDAKSWKLRGRLEFRECVDLPPGRDLFVVVPVPSRSIMHRLWLFVCKNILSILAGGPR
jgi:hypothetical protein